MNKHLKQILWSVSTISGLLLVGFTVANGVSANQVNDNQNKQPVAVQRTVPKQVHTNVNNGNMIQLGAHRGHKLNKRVNKPNKMMVKRSKRLANHSHKNKRTYYPYKAYGNVNVDIKLSNKSTNLYNAPKGKGVKHVKKLATTKQLNLTNRWVHADKVAYLKTSHVFYHFNNQNNGQVQGYWVPADNVSFNLKALRGHNRRLEHVIDVGERLIGHSKYYDGAIDLRDKRFDCSEFVRWVFRHGGVYLGHNTFTQRYDGRHVNYHHMKRGDIFFFNDPEQGAFCHVGIYLGHNLFLHDSPDSNNGGVGVSTLKDPFWTPRFNKVVRRIL